MSSAFTFQKNIVWGTNGTIEEILIKLIKYSPDDSKLLQWSIEHYREFWPGLGCDLTDILSDNDSKAQWREAIQQALDDMKNSGILTEYGLQWLEENREELINIAEAPISG